MYHCQSCGKVPPPGVSGIRVVAEKRQRTYPFRQGANRPASWKEDKQERINSMNDSGGEGWETAVSKLVCPPCANTFLFGEQTTAA